MSNKPPHPLPATNSSPAASQAISVLICCANCEDTLAQAIESAQWADEVVVIDSGSHDRTGEIGQALADRYIIEPWRGYTEQKIFGAAQTKNDWIFILDGDETITPELRDEIQQLPANVWQDMDLIHVRRRNFVMGRPVRAWDPDWLTRLMNRQRCDWGDEVLHDSRTPSHPSRQCRLRGRIEHKRHSAAGFRDYFDGKLEDSRLLIVARQMHERGRRCSIVDIWLRPAFAFFKFYVIKGAWRDGAFGVLIAQMAARGAHLKYAALWAVQNNLAQPKRETPELTGTSDAATSSMANPTVSADVEPTTHARPTESATPTSNASS